MVCQGKEKLLDVKQTRKTLFKTKNSILQEGREIELNSTETEERGRRGF